MFNLVNRLGININIDEAKVLVASANKNKNDDLGLDEFLELIFSDNEALNVDLDSI